MAIIRTTSGKTYRTIDGAQTFLDELKKADFENKMFIRIIPRGCYSPVYIKINNIETIEED